jgi:hypothetical protein
VIGGITDWLSNAQWQSAFPLARAYAKNDYLLLKVFVIPVVRWIVHCIGFRCPSEPQICAIYSFIAYFWI